MLSRSADANTSAGAPACIWATSADDAAKFNVTVAFGFRRSNCLPSAVNASVSDAAAETVIVPAGLRAAFAGAATTPVATVTAPSSSSHRRAFLTTERDELVTMKLIYAPRVAAVTPALSLTDWIVLALLSEAPAHGFALARALATDAELGQVWTVRRALVYRALDHLESVRLVEPTRVERGDQGPRRTVYRPTRAGRARVTSWLAEPVAHPRDARTELLVKFMLLARRAQPLTPLADRQLEHFVPMRDGLAAALGAAEGARRVVARWRFESLDAITRGLVAIVDDESDQPRAQH